MSNKDNIYRVMFCKGNWVINDFLGQSLSFAWAEIKQVQGKCGNWESSVKGRMDKW
jgi:hypothetical protein